LKLSEQAIKTSTPGILQTRRYINERGAIADMIYDELKELPSECVLIDPLDATRRRAFSEAWQHEDLLVPVVRKGGIVRPHDSLTTIRERVQQQLDLFHVGIQRHLEPHEYPVGLEQGLYQYKTEQILKARQHQG